MLAELARGRLRAKTDRLTEALTGRFTEHRASLLTQMLQRIDAQLGESAPAVARLDAIPGVGPVAARMIVAEIGFADLGPDHSASRTNPRRRVRHHIRELQALGYTVTLDPAA